MAQSVLSDLNDPSTDTTNATEVNGYRDGSSLVDHSINVPMEYGRLNIRRVGRTVERVAAELDYSSMPDSLIDDLSDGFGWSSSEKGILGHDDSFSDPKFARHVTESEENDVANVVSDYDSRNDVPINMIAMNNDGGFYRVLHYDVSYHVDSTRSTVKEDVTVLGSQDECTNDTKGCMVGIGGVSISCGSVPIACAGTDISPFLGDEVGCVLAAAGCGYQS
jgi:hypothetical protein